MNAPAITPNLDEARARLARLSTDWRFAAENLYKIVDVQTSRLIPIRFNEAQVRLEREIEWFESRERPVRLWILKSRRAGLSTGCLCKVHHRVTTGENTNALIVANQDGPAKNLLNICRIFWMNTPRELRPPIPSFLRDTPPESYMKFPTRLTGIYTASSKSLDQYVSFGFKVIHCSEVSRYTQGDVLFSAIYPTLGHDPASIFFGESTALGQGNFFHEQCLNAREQQGRGGGEYGNFRLLFIARQEMSYSFRVAFKDDDERRRLAASLTKAERELMAAFPSIGLEQIKWERTIRAGAPYNRNPDQFEQDYPTSFEEAFLASGVTVFGKAAIRTLSRRKRDPEFVGDVYWGDPDHELGTKQHPYDLVRRPLVLSKGDAQSRGYRSNVNEGWRDNLKIFRRPRRGERLFVGGDVGRGDMSTEGGDFSTLVVVALNEDGGKDEVLLTWRGHCNPVHFAELSSALCWWLRYQVGDEVVAPLLTIEWTGPGTTTNYEIDKRGLYDHTFRYFNPGSKGSKPTNHIGWESNGKTKPLMVDITTMHVQRDLIDIPDEDIITEMSIYRRTSDYDDKNSYEGVGGHDDLVTGLEIAVVTMRRQDLNYGSYVAKHLSAEPTDDDVARYGRGAPLEPFDQISRDSAFVRPTIREGRVLSVVGEVDVENLVAGGDWRNFDETAPSGAYEDSSGLLDWTDDGWDDSW
jgi:hypothetical protein